MAGIPPIITTTDTIDEGSLGSLKVANNHIAFEKTNEWASNNNEKDESTADESYTFGSDDESSSSPQSHHTNDSTRDLLKQAQQRIEHQSIYEEVKSLRTEVKQCKSHKLDLQNQCNLVGGRLAQALDTVQSYKLKELRWNDERAERERDFMNQLSNAFSTMEANEKNLMDEIIKRDMKIIELQNTWNEEEIKRMRSARERKKSDIISHGRTEEKKGIPLEGNWSDDSIGEFI